MHLLRTYLATDDTRQTETNEGESHRLAAFYSTINVAAVSGYRLQHQTRQIPSPEQYMRIPVTQTPDILISKQRLWTYNVADRDEHTLESD